MNLSQEFDAIVDALEAQGIPYAVCGGYAVMLHGYPRMTYDIDFLTTEEELPKFEQAVRPLGFTIVSNKNRFAFKRGTPEETRFWRVLKVDGTDHLTLDVLLVTPIIEEAWRTRCRISKGGREQWVVSLEGLAIMKKLAGRTKDLLDLQKLGIIPSDEEEPESL